MGQGKLMVKVVRKITELRYYDKQIQIIAGNRQNIEQGKDERGKFYKVSY